ncbi:MAG: ATP-binding protein [Desulfuromonadales bacterium]
MESSLRTVGERLEKIFNSLSDGLLVIDGAERVMFLNPSAEGILGLQQKALFPGRLSESITDRHLLKRLREAVDGRGKKDFEWRLTHDSGPAREITVDALPVADEHDCRAGTAFLLRDITYQKELDRLKSEFICTAAHELRTPLTAILGFSELLLGRSDLPPEQQRDFLGYIRQKAENLAEIITDLLDLSRIEAGRGLHLCRESCDINALVQETGLTHSVHSGRHAIEIVLQDKSVELSLDRGKITQVLENLLSNAIKYSPNGGAVQICGGLVPGAYQVYVKDEGIGLSRQEAARVFDKFYRVDGSHSAAPGTGLGLSISKHIVEAHGGRIWVESKKGQGATFYFTLPLPVAAKGGEAGLD